MRKRKRKSVLCVENLEDRKLLDASYDFAWSAADLNADHIVTPPTLQSVAFVVSNTTDHVGLFDVADTKHDAEAGAANDAEGWIVPAHGTITLTNSSIDGVSWNSFWVAGSDGIGAHIFVDDTPGPPVVPNQTAISWANPADITYGTPLSATQLDAHATVVGLIGDVPGTYVYTPAAGTVLHAGAGQTLSVQFTPTDLVHYTEATGTATINVLKATPNITWNEPADIMAGTPLSAAQLNAVGSVAGSFVYDPPAGTVLPLGQDQPLHTAFTPLDSLDYNAADKTVLIDVNPRNVPNPPQPPRPPWWNWPPQPPQPPVQTSVHLFNEQYYMEHNPDVAAEVHAGQFTSGYAQFLAQGLYQGRVGTPDWTPAIEANYLAVHPDVAAAIARHDVIGDTGNVLHSGYEHFVIWGQYLNRPVDPIAVQQPVVQLFSESVYLSRYPDVAAAVADGRFESGYQHFLQYGLLEGRSGSNDWTPAIEAAYLAANPDVASAVSRHDLIGDTGYVLNSGYEHFTLWAQYQSPGAPLVLQLDV